jgi:hypothetical protein
MLGITLSGGWITGKQKAIIGTHLKNDYIPSMVELV